MSNDILGAVWRHAAADRVITSAEAAFATRLIARERNLENLLPIAEALFDDDVEWDAQARRLTAQALTRRGLDLHAAPTCRPETRTCSPRQPRAAARAALARHVSRSDTHFENLLQAVGGHGRSVTVAVLDSGFDVAHPALADRLWTNPGEVAGDGVDNDGNGYIDDRHGYNFARDSADLTNGTPRHGTHVLGIATAGSRRIRGMAAVVFSPGSPRSYEEALNYAISNGARVINMSFWTTHTDAIRDAIARYPDVLFVKSAGNDGVEIGTPEYERQQRLNVHTAPNYIIVASSRPDGERARHSNYGIPYATVASRGANVVSTLPHESFGALTGTSMATPAVSNLAAKCFVICPSLTASQVHQLIQLCSQRAPEWDGLVTSGGIVNERLTLTVAAFIELRQQGLTPNEATGRLRLRPQEAAHVGNLAGTVMDACVA